MNKQLVISRYHEPLDWLNNVPSSINNILVYNKGQSLPEVKDSRILLKNIENVGREAQTWTQYIVDHYNKIPDLVYFVQGDPFHHTENLYKRLDIDYQYPIPLTVRYTKEWPGIEVTKKDLCIKYEDIEIRMGDINHFGNRDQVTTKIWFEELWNTIFNCTPPKVYYYGYGAMWGVPKKNLLSRSLDFWNFLNEKLKESNKEAYRSEIDAWGMEALWAAVFVGPNLYPSKL